MPLHAQHATGVAQPRPSTERNQRGRRAWPVHRVDDFRADEAWWYLTVLTIGDILARGLAKSGSREPYDDDRR